MSLKMKNNMLPVAGPGGITPPQNRSKSGKNADITAKKIKKTTVYQNPFISSLSRTAIPGITDITAKKIIKGLTFDFCYVRTKITTKIKNKRGYQ